MPDSSWLLEDVYTSGNRLKKSSFLGMKSTVVSSLKPMLRVSLPREPAAMALAMAWRSSLALVRQVWALRGRVLLRKLTQKVLFVLLWHMA